MFTKQILLSRAVGILTTASTAAMVTACGVPARVPIAAETGPHPEFQSPRRLCYLS